MFGDSNIKLSGGQSLKKNMNGFIERYEKDENKKREIRKLLLEHPYLDICDRQCAADRYKREREGLIFEIVDELKQKILNNKVKQIVPQNITGQRELTIDKFDNHKAEYINAADGNLVIKLERHPEGGHMGPLYQYWLYSVKEAKLYLIPYTQKEIPYKSGAVKIFRNGKWQDPTTEYRDSFERIIKNKLGHRALKKFKQMTKFPNRFVILDDIPSEVNDFCLKKLGFDINERERVAREDRYKRYDKKYGAPKVNDIQIDFSSIKLFGS